MSTVPNTGRSLTVYRGLDEDCAVKIVRRRKYGKIEREGEREREREREREIYIYIYRDIGGMSKSTGRSERVESGWGGGGDGGLADLQKTKGHRTELQQQRLQVCEKTGYEK